MKNLNKILSPKLVWMYNSRARLEFKGSYLKQDKALFTTNNIVNLYIVYELHIWSQDLNAELTLKDCFFEAVKLTKNTSLTAEAEYFINFSRSVLFKSSF